MISHYLTGCLLLISGNIKKKNYKRSKEDYGKTKANDIVRRCCLLKPPTMSVVD
ncbi:MAG: hypothetical protein HXY47_00165 [Nitrospirae bacterium]|nr:hypothetical protein [Nitrospirota bacterium]